MAGADISVDAFEHGELPAVCAATGGRSDRLYRMEATYEPGWPYWLLLLGPVGLLLAIVLSEALRRTRVGYLPFTDESWRRSVESRFRWGRRAVVLSAVGAALLAVGIGLVSAAGQTGAGIAVLVVALAALAGAGVAWFRRSHDAGMVRVAFDGRRHRIVVHGASTEFALACDRADSAQAQLRHRAVTTW